VLVVVGGSEGGEGRCSEVKRGEVKYGKVSVVL